MRSLTITKQQARRFLIAYHGLDRYASKGKESSIISFFNKVGSVQFDPIDVCGKNAELVLQSRIRNFKPSDLTKLLYRKRLLTEGWDKMMCIYGMSDYPHFQKRRDNDRDYFNSERCSEIKKASPKIIEEIKKRGPLSSLDLEFHEKIDWFWAPAKLSKASLELMYFSGLLGIHSRIHSRRKYDLAENLIPPDILNTSPSYKTEDEYIDWHILRRIGSLGFYYNKSGDGWLGMMKKAEREPALDRLVKAKQVMMFSIKGIDSSFYIRSNDMQLMEHIISGKRRISKKVSFLAPLDNFMWDRKLIEMLFGFKYRWEIYKPAKLRQYGYYVLPVLYGDKMLARFEPVRDKKEGRLVIKNWWWEKGVNPDDQMAVAVEKAKQEFADFLGVMY